MSFTYDMTTTGNALLISKVRLELGDTVEDAGVLPTGGNFTDAEILLKLEEYSNDIGQTVGALAAILARRWGPVTDITVGPRREALSQVSKRWQTMANELNPSYASFSIGVQRSDGYSEEVDDASEYAEDDD